VSRCPFDLLTKVPTDVPSPTSPARAWGLGVEKRFVRFIVVVFFVKGLHVLQSMCVFREMLSYDYFLDMAD